MLAFASLIGGTPAYASHTYLPCDETYSPEQVADFDSLVNSRLAGTTVCLEGGRYGLESDEQRINASHITVRSLPGHRVVLTGRLWITDQADQLLFYGLILDGSTGPDLPSLTVNGDRVVFHRNIITNRHRKQSCYNNNSGWGIAYDVKIVGNVIYDCGDSAEHDHGVYLGASVRPRVIDNWIYENAGRGVQIGSSTQEALVERNVISDNCAFHDLPPHGAACSANLLYWGASNNNDVQNNTIAYPKADRLNVDHWEFTGNGSTFTGNCLWSDDGTARLALPASVTSQDNIVRNPDFADRTSVAHATRDYRIPTGNDCYPMQPRLEPGPPAP